MILLAVMIMKSYRIYKIGCMARLQGVRLNLTSNTITPALQWLLVLNLEMAARFWATAEESLNRQLGRYHGNSLV